jgi:hypothetical protein
MRGKLGDEVAAGEEAGQVALRHIAHRTGACVGGGDAACRAMHVTCPPKVPSI